MSELPYMPVAINDEIAETSDLTNEELGALTRIKWAMWKSGGYLPDDGKYLARVSRAGSRWGRIAPAILALLTLAQGRVSSPSLLSTLLITRERRAKSVKAGSARWTKPERPLTSSKPLIEHDPHSARASPEHMLGPSNQNQNLKNLEEASLPPATIAARGAAEGYPDNASGAPTGDLNETLYVHGTELLVERVGLRTLPARAQISRWLVDVAPDVLARLLASADQQNLRGPGFVNVVDKLVASSAAEALFGRPLPYDRPQLAVKGGAK